MENLKIIKTLPELQALQSSIIDKEYVAVDTETTGVDKGSEVIGFSICYDLDTAYYVVLSYWDKNAHKLIRLTTHDHAKACLETLKGKKLIGQNFGFDASMISDNFGVSLIDDLVHDTLQSGHLLDENRFNGLKERAIALYGEDATKEQAEMKASILSNGGCVSKDKYELYKADCDLIAKYGAKDALLTYRLFIEDSEDLFEQNLDKFFYHDESMPLVRGPTYQLNTTGLRVDPAALQSVRQELEQEILEAKAFIYKEIQSKVHHKYPGTNKKNGFNLNATKQIAWLVFEVLGNDFGTLTDCGKDVCKSLGLKLPYTRKAKAEFVKIVRANKDQVYCEAVYNPKTKKLAKPKKINDYWHYLACGKEELSKIAHKYKWVQKYLEYARAEKILSVYVEGIQSRMQYNIIRPSFLQHGTTSGRYSSKTPNFQNLPREDRRIKRCIVSRNGKIFVGADYEQLEPRVFASTSQDPTLMASFAKGEDFYSVVGAPIFDKYDCTLFKGDENSFAKLYPKLRDISKAFALATPYGTGAYQQHMKLGLSIDECEEIIENYFKAYPKVLEMMLDSHEQAKRNGVVYNLFGRPRRIPEAKKIPKIYGKNTPHRKLPGEARTLLNLAMNHRVQSTGASIMNRAAIAVYNKVKENAKLDQRWNEVKIVLQVHDELVLEGPVSLEHEMKALLKDCMENTSILPGVALKAEPKSAYNLADLK